MTERFLNKTMLLFIYLMLIWHNSMDPITKLILGLHQLNNHCTRRSHSVDDLGRPDKDGPIIFFKKITKNNRTPISKEWTI